VLDGICSNIHLMATLSSSAGHRAGRRRGPVSRVVAESAEAARAIFEQLPFFEHGVVKIDDLFPVTQV